MSSAAPQFSVPRDGQIYIDTIVVRCHNLQDVGIWEGFDLLRLDRWLNNFKTESERYFAACILDAMIYRSPAQTAALMEQLFDRAIPDAVGVNSPIAAPPRDWHRLVSERPCSTDPSIRLVPVIAPNEPPTKSGLQIARLYRRNLNINDRWMTWPWHLHTAVTSGTQVLIFIDDFLGTGSQFLEFMAQFNLDPVLSTACCIYAPLVAHSTGIANVRNAHPHLTIACAELIDSSCGVFSNDSICFRDQANTIAQARAFYDWLLCDRAISISPEHATGFGQLGLVYAFAHATPDNSLPLLWWSQSSKWTPLFER